MHEIARNYLLYHDSSQYSSFYQKYHDHNDLIYNTALQNFFLKYTIDEYDHCYVLFAAESDSDTRFSSSRLDFAAHEVTNFRKQVSE